MNKRAQVVSQWLIIFFTSVLILTWGGGHLVVQLFTGAPLTLNVNDTAYPLAMGEISLGTLLFTIGLFVHALYQELAGFRMALFLSTQSLIGVILVWAFLVFVPQIPFLVGGQDLGAMQNLLIDLSLVHLAKTSLYLIAFMGVALFYASLRWLFKNGYYIVRALFSSLTGILVFSPLLALAQAGDTINFVDLLPQGLVIATHSIVAFLLLFPFHYFIKWPIFIFVGSNYRAQIKDHYSRIKTKKDAHSKQISESKPTKNSEFLEPNPVKKNIPDDLPNPFSKEDSVSVRLQNS